METDASETANVSICLPYEVLNDFDDDEEIVE